MNFSLTNQTNTSTSSVEGHVYHAVYSLFFLVGFPANCLSFFVTWRLLRKGNNMAVYLFTLSISDLLYIVSLPMWVLQALQKPIGVGLCNAVAVAMYNSFYCGSGLLCCISVDRYLALVYPLHFHWVREVKTAALVSVAVWALEIVIHIILLDHMGSMQATTPLCEQTAPLTQAEADVALIRGILGFTVPLFIMVFCFQRIMKSLGQSASILAEERKKVGLLLFFLLLTYFVSFFPYQSVMLHRAFLEPGNPSWAPLLTSAYSATVAATTINSTLDPIIYCLISNSAKREIRKTTENVKAVWVEMKFKATPYRVQSVSEQLPVNSKQM